jgi:FixJ family two-component response regulator
MVSVRGSRLRKRIGVRAGVPPKTKSTVFIVDDDASLLRALQRLLSSFDYDVHTFRSAESFLTHSVPTSKACLLLDIFLPGMSGVDLCARMAASGRCLPTILMTARDDASTRKLTAKAGATAILYKPFDEDVLIDAIARALATHRH